jgi:hypothetical protein
MPPETPYTADLAGRDPIEAMEGTRAAVEGLTRAWTPADFERPYAAGKWSARRVLIHLAQTELALGTRARMALSTPSYVAQNFDQNAWIVLDEGLAGRAAVEAFLAVGRMNIGLFRSLSPEARQTGLSHPEYGMLTVDWILHQMAGHQIHHLRQLEQIR